MDCFFLALHVKQPRFQDKESQVISETRVEWKLYTIHFCRIPIDDQMSDEKLACSFDQW